MIRRAIGMVLVSASVLLLIGDTVRPVTLQPPYTNRQAQICHDKLAEIDTASPVVLGVVDQREVVKAVSDFRGLLVEVQRTDHGVLDPGLSDAISEFTEISTLLASPLTFEELVHLEDRAGQVEEDLGLVPSSPTNSDCHRIDDWTQNNLKE